MGSEQYSECVPSGGDMGLIERDRSEDCVVIAICPNPPNLFDGGSSTSGRGAILSRMRGRCA